MILSFFTLYVVSSDFLYLDCFHIEFVGWIISLVINYVTLNCNHESEFRKSIDHKMFKIFWKEKGKRMNSLIH